MALNVKSKKPKIDKSSETPGPDADKGEHDLSFYINDRVRLMKEVLKIIKPKKIKSMAPECIKDLDIEEINSMLLEELLGISNKRLKYIFSGKNLEEDSSSTDPEEENQSPDVISLDDVSDDDFVVEVGSEKPNRKAIHSKKIKKEKSEKKHKGGKTEQENLMTVLELLELQARARAIKSQLMLEANKQSMQTAVVNKESDDDDEVIIEIPKNEEIVINSSDSETEKPKKTQNKDRAKTATSECDLSSKTLEANPDDMDNNDKNNDNNKMTREQEQETNNDEDEIILIADQEEIDGIIGG